MRPPLRAITAALGAGAALGLIAGAGCSTQQCQSMQGSFFGGLLCGGEGTPAPEPTPNLPSACQPRAVMPHFFALVDAGDPSLAGLRAAVKDLGAPICLDTGNRACTSDDQCAIGHCQSGLCPCVTSYSPLGDVLGLALRAMNVIADDKPESSAQPPPGCLTAAQAESLPADQRNRICELRRALDVLLQQNGGINIVNDPDVKKVLISLLDYIQGNTTPDHQTHYDLLVPVGRLAAANTAVCDPAALWQLLDNMLGYLTPSIAATQLGTLQLLLADPNTKALLGSLTASGGAQGRDSMILLVHTLSPGIVSATSAADVLGPNGSITQLVKQFVDNSSTYPQSFKDEVHAALDGVYSMLSDKTFDIFTPLQHLVACMGSPEVRCIDPSTCTNHDDALIGALYDVISLPEAEGGIDLATLVGALKSLATLDQTGQTGRTVRLIVQGIEGSPDPNDPHEVRGAVTALAKDALTAEEGQKLMPALSVLIDRQVLPELFSLLQDLLYTCKPPTGTPP